MIQHSQRQCNREQTDPERKWKVMQDENHMHKADDKGNTASCLRGATIFLPRSQAFGFIKTISRGLI